MQSIYLIRLWIKMTSSYTTLKYAFLYSEMEKCLQLNNKNLKITTIKCKSIYLLLNK